MINIDCLKVKDMIHTRDHQTVYLFDPWDYLGPNATPTFPPIRHSEGPQGVKNPRMFTVLYRDSSSLRSSE